MISTLLIVAGVILVTAASVLIFCVLSAPEGHEDSSGFPAGPSQRNSPNVFADTA